MSRLTDKLFGTHSQREIKRIRGDVDRIESLRPAMQALTDEELRAKTDEFKNQFCRRPMRQSERVPAAHSTWSPSGYS